MVSAPLGSRPWFCVCTLHLAHQRLEPEQISPEWLLEKYERDAGRYWDRFYRSNTRNFFKDRHWLLREFPPLRPTEHVNLGTPPTVVLEVGCGVGNTVFPLLEDNPHLFVYAVDFSPYAIELLKANAQYNEQHCNGFVCDASDSNSWPSQIAEASVDIVLLIFVLSAMSPEKMELALKNIHKVVKPGGIVCFRDYARGDLAQQRFEKDTENKLGENFHVRGDGTRAYYFTKAQAKSLFEKAGFMVINNDYCEREVVNRKLELHMHRIYIQGCYKKPC